ncbi:MAG: DegV family EDD domain-containing protein, partial [Clostridiales bacterium]|nr:DegV family EDD domain-containing protein [Clostridiales bacterium]
VELMGGQITVDSIYTKGSDFTVVLEQQIIDSTPIGPVNFFVASRDSYRRHYRQSFEAPEARVLIVDDNDMNRLVADKLLRPTKVMIDTAASGEECLEFTAQKHYQVILMDQLMSVMDGIETLNAVRRQDNGLCRDTPIVLMTANSMPGMGDVYEKYGFQGYLEKPVDSERLEEEVLRFIPEDMLEYKLTAPVVNNFTGEVSGASESGTVMQKKRGVRITTDCVSDMSPELLAHLEVEAMYLYITTDTGRFCDMKEVTSDNLTEHLSHSRSAVTADSATVEEFEEFYAKVLSEAEEVVHISMASRAGRTFNIATQAARSFGRVHVIDSGQISGGEALVVMYAAKLAREGMEAGEICSAVEQFSRRAHSMFILPSLAIFYQHGYVNRTLQKLSSQFGLHPTIRMNQSALRVTRFCGGTMEHAWKVGIRRFFVGKGRLDTSIVYVTHVGLTVRQQRLIEEEIKKYVRFDEIIFESASVSNACNSGFGSLGISCIHK